MKRQGILRLLSIAFCVVLVAAMALMTGCKKDKALDELSSANADYSSKTKVTNVGKGDTQFDFTVIDKNGKETRFRVSTNKKTVGAALLETKLIKGENGDYGLYVKTVNGITLDFDDDGMYWAFYVNDEYAMSGVDKTVIAEDDSYSFKAEK